MSQNNETSSGMCMALAPSFLLLSSIPADYPLMCSEYAPVLGVECSVFPFEFYCHLDEGVPFTENCIGIRLPVNFRSIFLQLLPY